MTSREREAMIIDLVESSKWRDKKFSRKIKQFVNNKIINYLSAKENHKTFKEYWENLLFFRDVSNSSVFCTLFGEHILTQEEFDSHFEADWFSTKGSELTASNSLSEWVEASEWSGRVFRATNMIIGSSSKGRDLINRLTPKILEDKSINDIADTVSINTLEHRSLLDSLIGTDLDHFNSMFKGTDFEPLDLPKTVKAPTSMNDDKDAKLIKKIKEGLDSSVWLNRIFTPINQSSSTTKHLLNNVLKSVPEADRANMEFKHIIKLLLYKHQYQKSQFGAHIIFGTNSSIKFDDLFVWADFVATETDLFGTRPKKSQEYSTDSELLILLL